MADLRNDSSLAKPTNGLFLVGREVVTYRSLGKGLFRGVWNSKTAASLRGHPARVMAMISLNCINTLGKAFYVL